MDGFEVSLLRLARCQGDAFSDAANNTRIGCDPTPVSVLQLDGRFSLVSMGYIQSWFLQCME